MKLKPKASKNPYLTLSEITNTIFLISILSLVKTATLLEQKKHNQLKSLAESNSHLYIPAELRKETYQDPIKSSEKENHWLHQFAKSHPKEIPKKKKVHENPRNSIESEAERYKHHKEKLEKIRKEFLITKIKAKFAKMKKMKRKKMLLDELKKTFHAVKIKADKEMEKKKKKREYVLKVLERKKVSSDDIDDLEKRHKKKKQREGLNKKKDFDDILQKKHKEEIPHEPVNISNKPRRSQPKGTIVKSKPEYEYVYIDKNGKEVKASASDLKGADIVDDTKVKRRRKKKI